MIPYPGHELRETGPAALERALIGSLINGDVLPSQLGMAAREFGDPMCRRLFEIMRSMEEKHTGIDYAGVCAMDESMDPAEIHRIWEEQCISSVLIARNVNMLRDAALLQAYRAELQRAIWPSWRR